MVKSINAPQKQFQRTTENFTCQKCGFFVIGNGFTNHCARCLWSKHVDIHPGDRLETCAGLMKPIAVYYSPGQTVLTHCCIRCGKRQKNKASKDDDFETILMLVKKEKK